MTYLSDEAFQVALFLAECNYHRREREIYDIASLENKEQPLFRSEIQRNERFLRQFLPLFDDKTLRIIYQPPATQQYSKVIFLPASSTPYAL